MFKNIGKAFIDMATQMIAKALVMKALGILTGGMGGGGGGGMGSGPSLFDSGGTSFVPGGLPGLSGFAGGGYTGGGARAGGMDGQGGFPAILHPQETVVDHTALNTYSPGNSGGGGGGPINVSYNGPQLKFNGDDYVPRSAVPELIATAAKAGAKEGQARTMNSLRNSRSQRGRIGL